MSQMFQLDHLKRFLISLSNIINYFVLVSYLIQECTEHGERGAILAKEAAHAIQDV